MQYIIFLTIVPPPPTHSKYVTYQKSLKTYIIIFVEEIPGGNEFFKVEITILGSLDDLVFL